MIIREFGGWVWMAPSPSRFILCDVPQVELDYAERTWTLWGGNKILAYGRYRDEVATKLHGVALENVQ